MVVVRFRAGLGNQLFQYATARAVAVRLGSQLLLDTQLFTSQSDRQLDIAQLRIRGRTLPTWMRRAIGEPAPCRLPCRLLNRLGRLMIPMVVDRESGFDPSINLLRGSCNLLGFWQSEKYFASIRPLLIREMVPAHPLPDRVNRLIAHVEQCDSIAVHVRRGDLLTNPVCVSSVGTLSGDYYAEALSRLIADAPKSRIYVFTEDRHWVEQNMPRLRPITIVSGEITTSAVEDLAVMSRCRNFVIANSTFSWWGAWLGDASNKRIIAPSRFFRTFRAWEQDLVPPQWERVHPQWEQVEVDL